MIFFKNKFFDIYHQVYNQSNAAKKKIKHIFNCVQCVPLLILADCLATTKNVVSLGQFNSRFDHLHFAFQWQFFRFSLNFIFILQNSRKVDLNLRRQSYDDHHPRGWERRGGGGAERLRQCSTMHRRLVYHECVYTWQMLHLTNS